MTGQGVMATGFGTEYLALVRRGQDEDAQAFADYLDAENQAAREDIARQLARRGYLTGARAGQS